MKTVPYAAVLAAAVLLVPGDAFAQSASSRNAAARQHLVSGSMQIDACSRSSSQRETCLALDAQELALDPYTIVEVRERFYDMQAGQEGERWISCWFENKRLLATSSTGAAIDFTAAEPPCTRGGSIRDIDTGELTDWAFPANLRVQAYLENPRYITRFASMQVTQDTVEGSVYRERCRNAEGGPADGALIVGGHRIDFRHATAAAPLTAMYTDRSCVVVQR